MRLSAGQPCQNVSAVETRDWLLRKVAESGIKLGRRAKTTTKVDKPVEEIGIWRRYDTQGRFRSVDAAYSRAPGRVVSRSFKTCDFGFNEDATVRAAIEWREAGIEKATKERPIDIRAPRVFLPGSSRN